MPKKPCMLHDPSCFTRFWALNPAPIGLRLSMCRSARLYHCIKCHAQVIICQHCDRGHRYCLNGCAAMAKKESRQRASKKYQATRQGQLNNAARQQRFRDKQKQKVTHPGSPKKLLHVVLTNTIKRPEKPPQTPKSNTLLTCHQPTLIS